MTPDEAQKELVALVASCHDDPLRFVMMMFPWGEPGGPLENYDGPDTWQREFLEWVGEQTRARAFDGKNPVAPIKRATASGHGIGKSVLVAWITLWIMSTRPHARGTITANTFTQLRDKTWASVQKWTALCMTGHWFTVNADRMYHAAFKSSWFCAAQSCREENSEAFAGQHAADSSSFYIFDEDSAVPDMIHEVAEGGLTDGEPFWFLFGNPTRSSGRFYEACFGSDRERWEVRSIDSRTSKFTNKAQIAEWVQDYGEDSDFVRVRVRGLPPKASDLQFIDSDRVLAAQKREPLVVDGEPLLCGLDVARGGMDTNVFCFRRGPDARTIPAVRIPGEESRDSMRIVTKAADILDKTYDGRKVEMLFVDGTGIGGPIADRLRQLGYGKRILEVIFSARAPDQKYANMRAFIWGKLRDWLSSGCINDSSILEHDLTGPGYMHDRRDRILLESKEKMKDRGVSSPDEGDAIAMTFAAPVVTQLRRKHRASRRERFQGRGSRATAKSPNSWMH